MKRQTLITKHIDKIGLGHIKAGSIKIGTLCGYRAIEKQQMLTADNEEGWLTFIGDEPQGIAAFSIPSEGIYNCICENNREGHILIEESFDSWVFCASSGAYSRARHESIVYGKKDYKGNSSYTEYVVFDLVKLFDALTPAFGVALKKNPFPDSSRMVSGIMQTR